MNMFQCLVKDGRGQPQTSNKAAISELSLAELSHVESFEPRWLRQKSWQRSPAAYMNGSLFFRIFFLFLIPVHGHDHRQ